MSVIPRLSPTFLAASLVFALLTTTGTANPHFFPRLRPLFAGLDESKVPPHARAALAEAKIDFERARHAEAPRFAVYAGPSSDVHGKVYQGRGYLLTEVHEENFISWTEGPKIVLDPKITGSAPYRYSEVDVIME